MSPDKSAEGCPHSSSCIFNASRVSADKDVDAEDDLDSVDADEDAEYEAFLEELSSRNRHFNKFLLVLWLLTLRRYLHTVLHTVEGLLRSIRPSFKPYEPTGFTALKKQ